MDVGRLSKVILNSLILIQEIFFWMEGVVALRRFRTPVVHKKGGCWLQVVALCRFKLM